MINLDWVSKDYLSNSLPAEKVRDFLAGMTYRYFENVFKQITNPKRVNDFGRKSNSVLGWINDKKSVYCRTFILTCRARI